MCFSSGGTAANPAGAAMRLAGPILSRLPRAVGGPARAAIMAGGDAGTQLATGIGRGDLRGGVTGAIRAARLLGRAGPDIVGSQWNE